MRRTILFSALMFAAAAQAEDGVPEVAPALVVDAEQQAGVEALPAATESIPTLFQAKIEEHTAEEMFSLLSRAERIAAGQDEYSTEEPIAMVLYGDEIEFFKRQNYRDNKALVDLAARLDAFNIIDVKVCTYWLSQRGIELTDLPPFIDSVSAGDQETRRLEKAGYAYF